jgi:hypothetical protein
MEGIMDSYYLNKDGTLRDDRVLADLDKAKAMYQDGEVIEASDILLYITNAIRQAQ